MSAPDLEGSVAVVTGGAGAIGRAIVSGLVGAGAAVAVADLVEPGSVSIERPGVTYRQVDVTSEDQVRRWLDEVESTIGTPTIVAPAAATVTVRPLLEISAEDWSRELSAVLTAPFLVARDAARRMVRNEVRGRIVLIGSWAAHAPHPHVPAYSAAKAGLRMLTRCLASELAAHDIAVNEVAIGVVDAGLSAKAFALDPALRERAVRASPLGRLVSVDDIASEVLHLCDPTLNSTTGSTVLVDCGMSLRTAMDDD